jgi:tRNA (adenine37-N6)-methyltransferase
MISIAAIGNVVNQIDDIDYLDYQNIISEICLNEHFTEESLREIEYFSHLEVVFFFHKTGKQDRTFEIKKPLRQTGEYPHVGIFASRTNDRPSRIGQTIVKLEKVEGKTLYVKGLDTVNGTPIIDIKPVIRELIPHPNEVIQPSWAKEMMKNYK